MSNDNLSNFAFLGNNLEEIYQKLWSTKAIVSLLEDYLTERQNGKLVQVCFVLIDLIEDIEALLPEM